MENGEGGDAGRDQDELLAGPGGQVGGDVGQQGRDEKGRLPALPLLHQPHRHKVHLENNKYGSVQELSSTFGNLKSLFWFVNG